MSGNIGTPPGGLSREEWAKQQWTEALTVDADGSYTISAWLPGNPIYDDEVDLAAMRCLLDTLQTPASVRALINAPSITGTTSSEAWQVDGRTIRVQWTWDAQPVLTLSFWQD